MSRRLAVFLLLLVSPHALAADLAADDRPRLEGAWTAIAAQRNGASAGELVGHRIEFESDRFRISKADAVIHRGRFAIDPERLPARIDFRIEDGDAKGQDWAGIFRIENDTLTVCDNAPDRTALRPRDFAAAEGSGHVCLTFRR